MLTISNQIRDLKPDSWYNFKKEDMLIIFDNNKRYGVDEDSSYIFNSLSSNYLVPTWNTPVESFRSVDMNYTSNQLAESEFLFENDGSIMCGRNNTKIAGLLMHETTEDIESLDDVLRKIDDDERREYLFQFRASTINSDYNYITFNYEDESKDNYIPIVLDTKSPESSFSVTEKYSNKTGNIEIWSSVFNPQELDPDGVGIEQDMREMVFKLVNPKTGETISNSRTYMFTRNGALNNLNSEEIPNPFLNYGMYKQQEYAPGKENKIKLTDIVVKKSNKYYRMKEQEGALQLNIPKVDEIYYIIETPYLSSARSYELGESLVRVNSEDYIMEFLGLRFYYNLNNKTLRIYNVEKQAFESFTFSSDSDETLLFLIKTRYLKMAEHDPNSGKFHYKMILQIKSINKTNFSTIEVEYKGGIKNILYKGLTEINSIPSFDSKIFQIGNMPQNTYNRDTERTLTKTIDCKIDRNGQINQFKVPSKIIHRSSYAISALDNFCLFINRNIEKDINKLYISQFREDDSILDKSLIQYWPMDNLIPENLRSSKNTKNTGATNINYDLYSYMKYGGRGSVSVEDVNHSVVKKCIYFDGDVTGNSNTFSSWSNNSNYTINFWFKSNQKSKGVILCDMDKESIVTAGIYIGVSERGTLEVAFNTTKSRIYNNNITDNEWHMISLVISETREYLLYLDSKLIDTIIPTTGVVNKNYIKNYQIYFMGHPLGKNVKGYLSRIGFYGTRISSESIFEIYQGDIEHRIYGTILASNMPFGTEIRFYDFRTGKYLNSAYSSNETGKFIYRNYDGMDVHLLVVNNNHKYGTIQVMGPLTPASVKN